MMPVAHSVAISRHPMLSLVHSLDDAIAPCLHLNRITLGAASPPPWVQFVPLILPLSIFAVGGVVAFFAISAARKRQGTPPPIPKIPKDVGRTDNAGPKQHGRDA